MSKIDNQIEELATKLEKSVQTEESAIETLKTTVKEIGKGGIEKAMPKLTDADKELLKSVLSEMVEEEKVEKAVEMDANYSAERKFIKVPEMGTEEESGSDDDDEKLVMESAAQQKHQGDATPEGIEGQVIKSEEETKTELEKSEESNMSNEELKSEIKELMAKGLSKEEIKAELLKSEKKEIEKEVKKEMKEEEEEEKEVKELAEKEAKEEVKDHEKKMHKSVVFGSEHDLLKANTQGRNFHFSVNAYEQEELNKSYMAKMMKMCKAGKSKEDIMADMGDKFDVSMYKMCMEKMSKMEKSEKADDINDLIEKGLDQSYETAKTEAMFKSQKLGGEFKKSFSDVDIATALNLSEEEAKELLGE